MNDLMKRMDYFKKEMLERKLSKSRMSESDHAASTSSLLNVRTKGISPVKLFNGLKSPKMNNRSVQNRDWAFVRTYKLDAVKLLDSRVRQFLAKHFRIWRTSLEAKLWKRRSSSLRVSEDSCAIRASPIVEVHDAEQKKHMTSRRRMTQTPAKMPLLKAHRIKQDFSKGINKLTKSIKTAVINKKRYGFLSLRTFANTDQFYWILLGVVLRVVYRKFKEFKPPTQTVNLLKTIKNKTVINKDKDLLKTVQLNQVLSEIYFKNFRVFFKKFRNIQEHDKIRKILRGGKIADGMKRLNCYYKMRLSKVFCQWERNARTSYKSSFTQEKYERCLKLSHVLTQIVRERQLLATERFWWKSLLEIQHKKESTQVSSLYFSEIRELNQ